MNIEEPAAPAQPVRRRRVAGRTAVAVTIGGVLTTMVVAVGAATFQPHSITAGGATAITVVGQGFGGDGSVSHGPGWIDVQSWSWGASNSANIGSQSSGAGAGKVTFNPFSITRKIDSASPVFFGACASKRLIPSVTFETDSVTAGDGTPPPQTLQITLTNAMIKACSWGGSGGDAPTESVSFNFSKIEFKYTEQSTGVVTRYGWDIKANKKF